MNTIVTRLSSLGLVALVLLASGLMLHDNGWLGLQNGMQTSPTFQSHPGRWGLVILSSMQVFLVYGLYRWGWAPKPLFLLTASGSCVTLLYFLFLRAPDGREPITEWDQVVLIGIALLLALYGFIKSTTRPGKHKVQYLLPATWSLGVLVIQLLFHFTMIFPAAHQDAAYATQDQNLIASLDPANLKRLVESGALPLLPLDEPYAPTLRKAGVARDDSVLEGLERIAKDNPNQRYIWTVSGIKDVDQIYVVWDPTLQQAWIAPASAYMQTRLLGMRAYMGGMAFFTLIWTLGLLTLVRLHSSTKHRKTP